MRAIYITFIILLLPVLLSAQKKSSKAITNYPITVKTENGFKTIQDPKINREARIQEAIKKSNAGKDNRAARMTNGGPDNAEWTGAVSDDWFDPDNWDVGEVPGANTFVNIFPGSDNDPYIPNSFGEVIIGGLQMYGTSLSSDAYVRVYNMFVIDNVSLEVYQGIEIRTSFTEISNSYIQTGYSDFKIDIADGEALIYGNYFSGYGDYYFQDSPSREGAIHFFENEFEEYSHVYITNKATGQGEDYIMYIANGEGSDIFYSLTINNNSGSSRVLIGTGTNPSENEQLIIKGHLDIQRAYNTGRTGIYVSKITFAGDEFTLFNAKEFPGIDYGGPISPADPVMMDKLFFEKDHRFLLINDNITVTELLHLSNRDSYLQMVDTKALTMLDGSEVVDENPENGSFVMGRMIKEGNKAFTFPIGAYFDYPIYSRPIAPNSSHRTMALEGRFKAPLSISAPQHSSEKFRAEYLRENPHNNGFDTSSHSSEVSNIFYDGYWELYRLNGNSNVEVTLTYDQDHYEIMELDKENLKIAGWQGNQWENLGAKEPVGTEGRGTITTNAGIDMYGPLALHSGIATRVPVITIDSPTDTYEFCRGNRNFTMHISMDTLARDGSTFDVQISDINGSFENSGGLSLGTVYYEEGKLEYQINVTLRNYSDYKDNNYKLRVVSYPQGAISINTISLVENTIPEQVTIVGPDIICTEDGPFRFYPENYQDDVTYTWTINSINHTLEMLGDTALVTFLESGRPTIHVTTSNSCGSGPFVNEAITVNLGSIQTFAAPVTNMMPIDGSVDQKLPLVLSWVPGGNSLFYDIHIWEEGTSRPENPMVSKITTINHSVPESAGLEYGKTYNWQVNSSLGCIATEGPIQSLKLRNVPDLEVVEINAPGSANSGQNITIDFKVKNVGLAETMTNETWNDGVFLSPLENHTAANFNNPATDPDRWNPISGIPLLVGSVENVAALEPGDEYTSSASIHVPLRFDLPLYAYVITNYKGGKHAPAQTNYTNDTIRTVTPIAIIPLPTPDLRVEEVSPPASAFSGSTISVTYEIQNHGVLTPAGSSWKDRIYISKDQVFNKQNAILLTKPNHNEMYYPADSATFKRNTQMEGDASIIYSEDVVIPNFISGTWFIHVVTNEEELLYEGSATGNNANNKQIQINLTPTPQFVINSLNIPVTDISNTQAFGIDWNVNNTGAYDNIKRNRGIYFRKTDEECGGPSKEAPKGYREVDSLSWGGSFWTDRVYLSDDPNSFNPNRAILLGEIEKGIKNSRVRENEMKSLPKVVQHCSAGIVTSPFHRLSSVSETTNNVILPGANYAGNLNVNIPKDLAEGEYYIYVLTNSDNTVFTYIDTPVVRRSHKLTLSHPDLSVADVSVPGEITGGTTFHLDYTVSNSGQGSLYGTASRKDYIYYSSSPVFDEQAELLKAFDYQDQIPFGESREYSAEVQLPPSHSGITYFFVKTNGNEAILESNFDNNLSAQTVVANVSQYPPADLVVSDISVDEMVSVPNKISHSLYHRKHRTS